MCVAERKSERGIVIYREVRESVCVRVRMIENVGERGQRGDSRVYCRGQSEEQQSVKCTIENRGLYCSCSCSYRRHLLLGLHQDCFSLSSYI